MNSVRFVASGAARLRVDDTGVSGGRGAAIVCLHAGVADRRMWAPQVKAFALRHRVVAYDRRGFGETVEPDGPEPETFSHLDDLEAVLDALAIDTAVLVGCSRGGGLALDFALVHPHRVSALVLIAASISGEPGDDAELSPLAQQRLDAMEVAERCRDLEALNALEAEVWLDGPDQPAGRVQGAVRELFLDMNGNALRKPTGGALSAVPPNYPRLRAVAVPTLVVSGALDFDDINRLMAVAAERIPEAEALVVENAAHLPSLERPAEFNEALRGFLERRVLARCVEAGATLAQ